MDYKFREIEEKWQNYWIENKTYKVYNNSSKPKFYVLDMFPYPSGAGLHVGHPLGYIASDIYSRYKRLKGFNVLHPMGFDSFGLPAEQYAIETGMHPAETTKKNIATFKKQLNKIGFCYDWDREVQTSSPAYYKWTQEIFLKLYNSYFCNTQQKARPITDLIEKYATKGTKHFSSNQWNAFTDAEKEVWLMKRRLAFSSYGEVNWCEALGTVLANDEVVNGVSERGGHPVIKKKMRQWYLRITAYADRLLQGLETVDFSDSMKEMQRNWIGKSEGAEINFKISKPFKDDTNNNKEFSDVIKVYTTRPDTIFGVDFMVIAPEHEMVETIISEEQKLYVEKYIAYVKSRSDRERQAEKNISGVFTGSYAINPFDGKKIPIWISEYVLIGYGTGAIMAVPCGDERDFKFAKHFNIPITNIIGNHFNGLEANPTKEATLENSNFLNGLVMKDAITIAINKLEELGIGKRKVNYKMRDAGFSRQRYWGEPFPIIWKEGTPTALSASQLPLELPHVEKYSPGPEGEGPLANIQNWINTPEGKRESSTMPGYAGSSWYFLRYMDPENNQEFVSRTASDYWNSVDLYIGGTEHAVGHLLYSRMWTKVLYDLGYIGFDEPFKRLVNQGMIQGSSRFVYRINGTNTYVSKNLISEGDQYLYQEKKVDKMHVDVNMVDGLELNIEQFKQWRNGENNNAEFILEGEKYICGVEVEKMSKSKYNTVNPDDLCVQYGADTFRMYEMFLGPVEQSKPWDTKGIEGVHRFLKKLWRLFYSESSFSNGIQTNGNTIFTKDAATSEELKVLHKTIKKIDEDTERFSYNTAVSAFMVCVNELADLKCFKKEILENVLILLAPYAPHIAEELWNVLGNEGSVLDAAYPIYNSNYTIESSKEYPVSINGKLRTTMHFDINAEQKDVEPVVLANEIVQKWLEGKNPKKIIFVKNKMINIVV
ncbi:MAG TPA: leucine--tRNA ligase [Chitinophagaceae bacterium]|nr:leucine--tRNA ligase [Chitinophagaceae bacterium]HMZ46028.1 leucine--tRNA ligase [Chitinophagaceae bacterium]HNJ58154.1 leucine--tRNA ligase [Chitinophagaceae bacterium]HNM34790.1 leucine--tRNA ligase [Chitinophagaceae bacterium]HNN30980.1 leucine--tRNA ligase [Chitinophagaceae bacterium]